MTQVADTHLSILSAKLVCPYANLGLYNGLNWFLHTTANWNNPENVSRLELYQVFSFFVVLMSLSTFTQSFGLRRFAVVGSNVFVLLLIRRWTGLESSPWVGVFPCDKSERYGSVPAFFAFFIKVFAALTACSAFPLLWGYPGEAVLCSNCHLRLNALNSSDEN